MLSVLVFFYFLCALLLLLYGFNHHVMVYLFNKTFPKRRLQDQELLQNFYGEDLKNADIQKMVNRLPRVTTQLPVFNEMNVAERLIDAAAAMEYPKGRHEIQILDDSTDETTEIIAWKVKDLNRQGVDIKHIRRRSRDGYKAGALKYGLKLAKGRYVAIFDADFVPPSDFLLKAMPYFVEDPKIGFVQARWGHLNRNESIVTRLQALGINGHFMIEQSARDGADLFMNFNGTAGLFSKQAILDAGDWQDDTLTEDMDLSYRIQLAGWSCSYLANLVVPAEIPRDINAFKAQQFRWAKGSIQTAKKLSGRVLQSDAGWFKKLQALLHMTHYMIHPLMLFLAIMALPILFSDLPEMPAALLVVFGAMLIFGFTGPSRLYLTAERTLNHSALHTLPQLPLMVVFGCGLAVNNTRAVFEAVIGMKSGFVRTPKQGFARMKRYNAPSSSLYFAELLAGLWCLIGMGAYFASNQYLVGHFMLIYGTGFISVGLGAWRSRIRR